MSYNRRRFLQTTGLAAAGTLLAGNKLFASENKALKDFGIQLWTLRDVIGGDPKGILKQLASYGYTQIESFEGPQGIFWGMSPSEFKNYTGDLGMKMISSHCNIENDFEKKAADAASIGMKYLICPYLGPQKTIDDFKRKIDVFNKCGDICKKNGIRFAYHNHDYSFKELEGQIPQDVMMQNTNADTVDFEMDMYWVVTAGVDPIAYMSKYKNRFRLCHVKDREKNATGGDASCILGEGSINYATILKSARKYGMKYFIVEQEKYTNSTPMESAKADAMYMKAVTV